MRRCGWIVSLALCLACLLAGCTGFGGQNINELLRAPALGQGRDEIQRALAGYLRGDEPQYKFPKEGDWRSPLMRVDLNGDGQEEAILLYTVSESAASSREKGNYVYVAILEMQDGAWVVTQDVQGLSTDVASLEVADLLGDGTRQLIVGYATTNLTAKSLALYVYSNSTLTQMHRFEYSRYAIGDFTGRGGSDLMVVSRDDQLGGLSLMYVPTRDGRFTDEPVEPVRLYTNFISCEGLYPSKTAGGEQVTIVDGTVATEGGALASQIVYYSGERFFTVDDSGAMQAATARTNPMLKSRDIDGDGVVEVPLRMQRNTISTPRADKQMEYVEWCDVTGEEPAAKCFGILDSGHNFFIALPDAWRGDLAVEDGAAKGEWRLTSRQTLAPLLSMRVVEAGEGDGLPVNAMRVPGATNLYVVLGAGIPEAERSAVFMVAMR